ncbi:MAG TPA: ABC transporter ATP-binding protein [Anaerolineales bacterium]|nr:ABC transporter ATP-binding protein [Anaerolineales bacterium]
MSGLITLEHLRFGYAADRPMVLPDLSLEIPPGTVTAILGPNGAGKTTLLHLVLGLLAPQGGVVRIAGRPLAEYGRRELSRQIALVPQAEHIPFDFTVLEYVLLGRSPYLGMLEMPGPADYRVAQEALALLGLTDFAPRPVTALSGGERQMAALARALAQEARILLLDEPTSHLDLSNKGRLLQTLRVLAGRGTTIVFTTHDPEMAVLAAQYVVLMRAGEIVDLGPIETVMTADRLTATYGTPVQVVRVDERPVVLLDLARPSVAGG